MMPVAWIFLAYVCLSLYDLGMTWVLQLMHYPLYHNVGAAEFSDYIRTNNQRAVVPAILPAIATLGMSLLMLWQRPPAVTTTTAWFAVILNLVVMLSTAIWQGRLHALPAASGKSTVTIDLLLRTNWIRTLAFSVQGLLAIRLLVSALMKGF